MVDMITAAIGAKMASASVQDMVETALSSVYKYKGQCTNSELASKTKTAGDVWEITDSGTYAAGTDVVCDGTNWNAMSGHLHVNVVDSLDSTSQQDALSANMGKALDTGKQDKLTAGTGISISAENVISASGGGSWTLRTPNDDWTDLFDIVSNALVFKKDTLIIDNTTKNCFVFPKNFASQPSSPIVVTCSYFGAYSTEFRINYDIEFDKNKITSSYPSFKKVMHGIQLTLDANNKLQQFYENSSVNKAGLIVYTKD